MEKSKEDLHRKPRRSGAVWAALALSAGLATAPVAALAEESSGTASGTGSDTSATTQKSGAQTQPQASDDDARGTVGQGATAQTGSQDTGSAEGAGTQVSAQAPAPSSDKGTYEEAGLHAVTVTYVDQSGRQIAPSHKEALADGESYSVASPEVGGYELVDPTQATVAGTVAKGSGDVTVKVVYRSTMVTYKVVHERQVGPKSSEYRVSETEALQAPAGSKVTVTPKRYDNYTCATKDLTLDVTADGNATLVIKYDVIVPTYGVYFQTSGSYVEPITGQVGDAVTAPANPTRAGYSFAGWDTDGDGRADALPATIPDHDVTAVAVWRPAKTTYQIRYWMEQEGYNNAGAFRVAKSVIVPGLTGGMTAAAARLDTGEGSDYQWYTYLREDAPEQIASDGSTVINVYYGWKTVQVRFQFKVPWQRKFGNRVINTYKYVEVPEWRQSHKLYEMWSLPAEREVLTKYHQNGGKGSALYAWQSGNWNSYSFGQVFPSEDITWEDGDPVCTFTGRFEDNVYISYGILDNQNADGAGYSRIVNKASELEKSIDRDMLVNWEGYHLVAWRLSKNLWDGKNFASIEWGDWQYVTPEQAAAGMVEFHRDLDKQNAYELRRDRDPYSVTYYVDGVLIKKESLLYGSSVDVSSHEGVVAPKGMAFAGWSTSPDGTALSSYQMPRSDLSLYALWKHVPVHVTFDSAGGSAVAGQTVAWGEKAARPADPTREGYEFGGWYYQAPGSSTPAPFPFDLGLEGDANLVAAWRSSNTQTSYTVIHRTRDGRVLATWSGEGTVGQTLTELALDKKDARREGHAYASASGITLDLSRDAEKNVYEFTYDDEPSFSYVVHLYDEATGLPVAADVTFDSERALLDYLAPQVGGYHVLFGGRGYLSIREGGQELTFWYERNPEQPAAARTATASATKAAPKHMTKVSAKPEVPRTGDATSDALALGVGALGAGIALLGSKFRRRGDEE